jgi:hypothetical protein
MTLGLTQPLTEMSTRNVNKRAQLDATICRHLFTAKSLYMFRASQHPSSAALRTLTATSGIGHNTGTATSFQCGLLRTVPGIFRGGKGGWYVGLRTLPTHVPIFLKSGNLYLL